MSMRTVLTERNGEIDLQLSGQHLSSILSEGSEDNAVLDFPLHDLSYSLSYIHSTPILLPIAARGGDEVIVILLA